MRKSITYLAIFAIPVVIFTVLFAIHWGDENTAISRSTHHQAIAPHTPWSAPTKSLKYLTQFPRVAATPNDIPVIAFHGINTHHDGYSMTQLEFDRICQFLMHRGFHTITADQYADWYRNKKTRLPSHPILIGFDDGRLDSYVGADSILAKYHMHATAFIITGVTIPSPNNFYLSWGELNTMKKTGRWSIQFHANHGHVKVQIDAKGHTGAFYGNLIYDPKTKTTETFNHYQERVSGDIMTGLRVMQSRGYSSPVMALPYNNDGALTCPKCARWLVGFLNQHFAVSFVNSAKLTPNEEPRFDCGPTTKFSSLYRYLVNPTEANAA